MSRKNGSWSLFDLRHRRQVGQEIIFFSLYNEIYILQTNKPRLVIVIILFIHPLLSLYNYIRKY